MTTTEALREALNAVEDPEIGMGIVDLGLVYDVAVDGEAVKITYTLTSMGCPVGPWIAELVWSPAWSPELMSEDAKFILGY